MIGSRQFWIGIGVSVLLLVLFLVTVDLERMFDALADADYIFVLPGLALYLISVLFRTLRWQLLLRHMKPISLRRLYPVVVVGYMANNLLPMRLGELVRSYYLGEREGVSRTSALVTIFIERVLDALTLLFYIFVIALFFPLAGLAEAFGDRFNMPWPLLVVAFSLPFIVTFGMLMLFAFYPVRTRAGIVTLMRPVPSRFQEKLRHLIDMVLNGLVPLRSPGTLALLFLFSIPIWLFEAGLFFFIGFSFDLNNVYDNLGDLAVASVLVTSVANIVSSIPAAPGGIGIFEIAARETLVWLPMASVERAVAGGFAAVVHFILLVSMILLGQVFLWAGHISLRNLSRAGRGTSAEEGPENQMQSRVAPGVFSADSEESQ